MPDPVSITQPGGDMSEVEQPHETWPIIEHEPEREPVVPPDLSKRPRRVRLTRPQRRALLAFDGPEPTDPTNEMIVGHNGVGNVRMVMMNLCNKGLCVRREHLNDDEGYRYELTEEGSALVKFARAPRHYVIESNA